MIPNKEFYYFFSVNNEIIFSDNDTENLRNTLRIPVEFKFSNHTFILKKINVNYKNS